MVRQPTGTLAFRLTDVHALAALRAPRSIP
jgi:hypothetical protein